MNVHVREAWAGDAVPLARILNAHIERGGTTALERLLTPGGFAAKFLDGERGSLCLVAFDADDTSGLGAEAPLGFQHVGPHPELPPDWRDVATFARAEPKVPGVGRALFAAMRDVLGGRGVATMRGVATINATIRADNAGGLAYYEAMGFRTYRVAHAVPLADGTPVDRVSKRFDLA